MKLEFFPTHTFDNDQLKYSIIVAFYEDQLVCVRHRDRQSWEIPGGHREPGEIILDCAARELEEETGAAFYFLEEAFDYTVLKNGLRTFGAVYYAEIFAFSDLPDFEIAELAFFQQLPACLTYPEIQPLLLNEVIKKFNLNFPKK